MEALVHGHDSNGLFLALTRGDRLVTLGAAGGVFVVEAVDAVDGVHVVDGEGDAVEHLPAVGARETQGVVRLPGSAQDPIRDRPPANGAFLQGVRVALFAKRLGVHREEGASGEDSPASAAEEAAQMEGLVECGAARTLQADAAPALGTIIFKRTESFARDRERRRSGRGYAG